MEIFAQHQELLFTTFRIICFLFCFFLVMILFFYNWLYLAKILKSNDHVGLRPPEHIAHLVKTCMYIPIFTAMFIVVFIILGLR